MNGSASFAASQFIKNSLINTSVIETVAHMIQQFVRTRKAIMVVDSSVQLAHLVKKTNISYRGHCFSMVDVLSFAVG